MTISAVIVLGAAVLLLCKYAGLKSWQALVCALFGFFLASTGLAPYISQFMSNLLRLL